MITLTKLFVDRRGHVSIEERSGTTEREREDKEHELGMTTRLSAWRASLYWTIVHSMDIACSNSQLVMLSSMAEWSVAEDMRNVCDWPVDG